MSGDPQSSKLRVSGGQPTNGLNITRDSQRPDRAPGASMSGDPQECFCPHGYVLDDAPHPAAGLEACPHGCTEKIGPSAGASMSGDPQDAKPRVVKTRVGVSRADYARWAASRACGIVRWTSPMGEPLVTLTEADFMAALVELYFADAPETARVCDEILDRRGALLGRVRDAINVPGRA